MKRVWTHFEGWWRDLGYAARVLKSFGVGSAASCLILTIAIGATTALFSLLDQLVYRRLPVARPGELVQISQTFVSSMDLGVHGDVVSDPAGGLLSFQGYEFLRDNSGSLSGTIAEAEAVALETGVQGTAEQAVAHLVSGNFFSVLEIDTIVGRPLLPSDDVRDGEWRVAVASYDFGMRRYGDAGSAIGATVLIRDVPFIIVGIAPDSFAGITKGKEPDLYVPLRSADELFGPATLSMATSWVLRVMGRLDGDVSVAEAEAEASVLWHAFTESDAFARLPPPLRPDPSRTRIDFADGARGYGALGSEQRSSLLILSVMVGLVLVIGSLNVGCLSLARAVARRGNAGIRLCLGARVSRLIRQSVLECVLIAAAGATGGIVAAHALGRLVLYILGEPVSIGTVMDTRMLAVGVGAAILTAALCGAAPVRYLLASAKVTSTSTAESKGVLPSDASGKGMIVIQVTLSLLLLAAAITFLRAFQSIRSVPVGFNAEGVTVVWLEPQERTAGREGLQSMMEEASRLASTLTDEESRFVKVGAADSVPFSDASIVYPLEPLVGRGGGDSVAPRNAYVVRVDERYFDAMEVPLAAGRALTERDRQGSAPVAVVSEALGAALFAGENSPVGQALRISETVGAIEIVGVASDVKFRNLRLGAPNVLYLPMRQPAPGGALQTSVKLLVRADMEVDDVAAIIKNYIQTSRMDLVVARVSSFEDDIGASYADDRLRMRAASILALVSLVLVGIALSGSVAFRVANRAAEIGIRVALGATPMRTAARVVIDCLKVVAVGIVLGVPAGIGVMKMLSAASFELLVIDTSSVLSASVIMGVVGGIAALGPALRAARIDPAEALRRR